jgi:alcohol dehydrogenase, iron-dependent
LGFTPKEDTEGVEILAKAIKMRAAKMSIPSSLRELGIPEDQYFSEMESVIDQIENDMCTGENPRRFSRIEMKQLLTDLY